ncbi:MAG: Methyl-accepting chemotaxis sensory transducer [Candidatus Falkowbacteria bacterium GW2011_GWC2_38_22]|uniref:Methyl-accepting chemotaxis sensory transducer n=1 Tax=Candidatus Falkowbacteria bacterium GW2011_GWE1_38_31 TaxID=1618638 RepID=A0A0G0K703_9BACT|nr:MAG: Methyl-accepting chemotaxis sensory transducer [Candidatus Falkowbacteria bacterium GW2011_GWF2_38_1205]KKQ61821.1 MAG: Methyl-accepting chemotaxis sensory transducer [Candidatus Falkowbacteria bacterium GW2011_GWC2_38_22]KKQ64129.1 MAG: Methyl-accepting chemotaxis sensory transducer [Candidatus Falkowbacteria bacterium GW2011_GWF1_38_22]KKQ66521.1 MAG: Methyl-accepting chemotaxis sensory transducer [Candidatus Falkowbacteria bacterium GW2011_GWE2_38_254]KKQ71235.1 MAG: Methyl-accepting
MFLIEWKSDYSVGVQELDDQHKKMFVLINQFYELMKETKDIKNIEKMLGELSDYGKYHLETEEKLFAEYGYPEKEDHQKIHDAYRAKIGEFLQKKDDALLSFEIIDFLEDWWLGHIASTDKKYQKFFNEKGLE